MRNWDKLGYYRFKNQESSIVYLNRFLIVLVRRFQQGEGHCETSLYIYCQLHSSRLPREWPHVTAVSTSWVVAVVTAGGGGGGGGGDQC